MRPPRCALRVRGCTGDSRKGHPAPAANGAHPCAPPFGFFPGPSAAAEGNPVKAKAEATAQQSTAEQSKTKAGGNRDLFSVSDDACRSPGGCRLDTHWRHRRTW
ncbi:hypothetical protein XhyaCFBP1156_11460 [Xanthomonas hyacinthi]|uniref:Uncharacterized protein n=1 Tax=Xanthomonas hyacinthi TaxID=56455 RepID=A0A2S7EVY0_9XANT|nr:hypothetical protein XhyaCFBP1156_11460 [Xanthomonas hyacinthi]